MSVTKLITNDFILLLLLVKKWKTIKESSRNCCQQREERPDKLNNGKESGQKHKNNKKYRGEFRRPGGSLQAANFYKKKGK